MSPRTARARRLGLLLALGLSLLPLQGVVLAGPAGAATNNACNGAFQGSPVGSLAMTASVPDGGTISAGQSIQITITWDTNDWSGLDQFADCFTIGGSLDDALTYEEKPPANDGVIQHAVSVPSSLSDGDQLCARSRLSGQPKGGNTTQKSNELCWTVGSKPHYPDVKVAKSASSTGVSSGDSVTFTITASNVGDATATNVQIEDSFDPSLSITSVSNGCSTNGRTVTCDLGDLAKGASDSVQITARTTDASCPSVSNHATVSASNEPASQSGNDESNTVTVDVSCPSTPDVKVTKSASSTSVSSGDSVTYTLTASNVGDSTAKDVQIKDSFDPSLTITSVSNGCSTNGQTVTCDLGDLAKGASASASVTVRTTDASCPEVSNQATVSASNEANAQTGNNASNTVKVDVVCPNPDVSIPKSSDAPTGGVTPGDRFTYTVTVESVGGATAKDVVVHDTIPDGLTIVNVSSGCSTSGQAVTCDLGDLAGGSRTSVQITVEATDTACPDVTNRATVSASNEAAAQAGDDTSNDVTDLVNCISPGISVRIVKTNDADGDGTYTKSEEARKPGLDVPFRLVIVNTGTPDIKITDLTDAFDQETLDLLASKCPKVDGAVLASGESIVCSFTLRNYSPPAASAGLVNTAKVCAKSMSSGNSDCDEDTSTVRSTEPSARRSISVARPAARPSPAPTTRPGSG